MREFLRKIYVFALTIVISALYYLSLPFVLLSYPLVAVVLFFRVQGSMKRRFKVALIWPSWWIAMGLGGLVQLKLYPLAPLAIFANPLDKLFEWAELS